MTKIRYDRNDMTLIISGHAGGGEKYNDIVCAGISVLEQTLIRNLQDLQKEGDGKAVIDHKTEGESSIHFIPKPWCRITAGKMFEFVMTGLRAMAESYPNNIHIEEE